MAVETGIDLEALDQFFNISLLNLLALALLVFLSIKKVPASLSLMTAALFAAVMAPFTQPEVVRTLLDQPGLHPVLTGVYAGWNAIATGFSIDTGIGDVDRLLSRGGMYSMLLTLWLIMGAVTFGTLLDEFGLLKGLIDPMVKTAKGTGQLFLTVFATAFGLNIIAGDQYIALVLPARTYRAEFARRGIAPTMLSRLRADGGTVTSPLVPWNSCGAFMGAVLGVPTLLYLPFCFFNIASPLLSVLYGFTGFRLEKVEPQQTNEETHESRAQTAD